MIQYVVYTTIHASARTRMLQRSMPKCLNNAWPVTTSAAVRTKRTRRGDGERHEQQRIDAARAGLDGIDFVRRAQERAHGQVQRPIGARHSGARFFQEVWTNRGYAQHRGTRGVGVDSTPPPQHSADRGGGQRRDQRQLQACAKIPAHRRIGDEHVGHDEEHRGFGHAP